MIKRYSAPDLSLGFAWDPDNGGKLSIIHGIGLGAKYEQIATGVPSEVVADLMVNMWCAGYRSRKREIHPPSPNKPHHHLFAEGGKMGTGMGKPHQELDASAKDVKIGDNS